MLKIFVVFVILCFAVSVKADIFQHSNETQTNDNNVYFFVNPKHYAKTNYTKQYYSNNFNHLFIDAGDRYHIDPKLLYAIAVTESSLNPNAVNYNTNGTVDMGLMQINSCHLATLRRYGISKQSLFNPKINITVGAWILSKCISRYGYGWNAIACYHTGSGNTNNRIALSYIWKVYDNLHN